MALRSVQRILKNTKILVDIFVSHSVLRVVLEDKFNRFYVTLIYCGEIYNLHIHAYINNNDIFIGTT